MNDVGNIVNAYRKSEQMKIAINSSYLSVPDGKPLAYVGKKLGTENIKRVAGPDLADLVFSSFDGNVKHFILGDTIEYQNKLISFLKSNYKEINICGTLSPPFKKWDDKINNDIKEKIILSDADIIWVCLGGGKQEIWMYDNYKKFEKGIFIGIGAGFRWLTGDIKRAPKFFQEIGMEWLFRFVQQPRTTFGRLISTLPYFIKDSIIEITKYKISAIMNSNKCINR